MNYSQAVDYLYNATPQFQLIGAAAYKPGLDTVTRLSALTGDSHRKFPIIHVAGTNGKGSTSHTLAAILQSSGLRTGLFTSPHLVDFRERIRVNGKKIRRDAVVEWIKNYISGNHGFHPSFFELTTVMAFDYFALEKVDIAVVEVGLGGRLDSTNIIDPVLSVITNISKDHVAQLGDKLTGIAAEKAGIIKPGVPAILGEGQDNSIRKVFEEKAALVGSMLSVASDNLLFSRSTETIDGTHPLKTYFDTPFGKIVSPLTGEYQKYNANTVMHAVQRLRTMGMHIPDEAVLKGFSEVDTLTGLTGRWSILSNNPLTVFDTGHNSGAWQYLAPRLDSHNGPLSIVLGFVNDKDIEAMLALMPKRATYYFTKASVPRALDPIVLKNKASTHGMHGNVYFTVEEACRAAAAEASPHTLIFIGGSNFIVADIPALKGNDDEP